MTRNIERTVAGERFAFEAGQRFPLQLSARIVTAQNPVLVKADTELGGGAGHEIWIEERSDGDIADARGTPPTVRLRSYKTLHSRGHSVTARISSASSTS